MQALARAFALGLLLLISSLALVPAASAEEATSVPPPAAPAAPAAVPMAVGVPPEYQNRWIEVDLTNLVAIAYEGTTPVYTALISAGRVGYPTPTGSFKILRRVANETMDSSTYGVPRGRPGYYRVTNVRYTQYITNDGVALHANYWSRPEVFGHRNDSHGCVGLRTDDAAWFWNFATVGTPVIVHHSDKRVVPPVAGLSLAEATEKLAAAGFQVQSSEERNEAPAGQVISQSPPGGSLAEPSTLVQLAVSRGPAAPVRPPEGGLAWVPEIVGLPEEEARQRLGEAGLNTGYANYQTEADIPAEALPLFQATKPGHVLSSNPVQGTPMPLGSVVQIAVRQP